MTGGAIGFLLGGWGSADLGSGSVAEAIIASAVPTTLLAARFGMTVNPDAQDRARIDQRARAVIFIGPALLFIFVTLVIPAIRTFYLSFLDGDSEAVVWLDNYQETFSDKTTLEPVELDEHVHQPAVLHRPRHARHLVRHRLRGQASTRGEAVEIGNPTVAPLLAGGFFVAFAVFTAFRGTIPNNLWWVLTVVFTTTALGLAIAVLADRAKHEKIAKSLIFMPLAISLVGASVIWRFMYLPRDASVEQTGLINALWVGLGRLSTGSGLPTIIVGVVAAIALALAVASVGRALVQRN